MQPEEDLYLQVNVPPARKQLEYQENGYGNYAPLPPGWEGKTELIRSPDKLLGNHLVPMSKNGGYLENNNYTSTSENLNSPSDSVFIDTRFENEPQLSYKERWEWTRKSSAAHRDHQISPLNNKNSGDIVTPGNNFLADRVRSGSLSATASNPFWHISYPPNELVSNRLPSTPLVSPVEKDLFQNTSIRNPTLEYSETTSSPLDAKPDHLNAFNLHRRFPYSKQNGNAKHADDTRGEFSPTSVEINVPRIKQNSKVNSNTYGINENLVSMMFLGIVSLIMSILGLQLLLRLSIRDTVAWSPNGDSLLTTNTSYVVLKEIAVTLSGLVVMLNLWCLLTSAMQFYFAVTIMKSIQTEERVFDFIKGCTVSRVISAAGCFFSIPIFMLALMLYLILDCSIVSSIISIVIFTSGIMCITATIIQSIYLLHQEKSKANAVNHPVDDGLDGSRNFPNNNTIQCQLSTLV